jgi:NAD+ kinase
MKVAVFGTTIQADFIPVLKKFFQHLQNSDVQISLYGPFLAFLKREMQYNPPCDAVFHSHDDFTSQVEYIFSIGGDGTFLHSFFTIRNFNIPIIGVNSGRLGFLADISQEHVNDGLTSILQGKYQVIERSLLEVNLHGSVDFDFNYALNEMTVVKTDTSSMIVIHAWINNEYMNSIWADGLIIATPTGSTAYSLSVGGPILAPDSADFVITPIAPHNLTVRPIVVPDHNELLLKVGGRSSQYRISLDSRSMSIDLDTTISVKKADFKLKTLHLPEQPFYDTLRNKLMWGADKRN